MEKSRLGISINLFAAMLYFLSATGEVLIIMIATGSVLFFENSEKLKRTAVKALIITVFLVLLTTLITWLFGLSTIILSTLSTYSAYNTEGYSYNYLYQVIQYIPITINNIMRILGILILVIFGFRAYKQKDVKIKVIDDILDKHF